MKQNISHKPPTNNTTDQSTANLNDQPRDQEIAKLKAEIEKLKQINQIGNTNMDHAHQNPQKIQTEGKVQESLKNGAMASSDPKGNVVNLTSFSFAKSEYKLLNKNLNLILTPKVYNKNELYKITT